MPESGEHLDQWVSACELTAGSGVGRVALPGLLVKQRSPGGSENFDLDQYSECDGSSLIDDHWQEMSFIPVYCGEMLAQLTATCSAICETEPPGWKPTACKWEATGLCSPSSPPAAAAAESTIPLVPGLHLSVMPAEKGFGQQWGVMDVAELPDCIVNLGPDKPVHPDHRTLTSQVHSLYAHDDSQQQWQLEQQSLSTLLQAFHSLCIQQEEQPTTMGQQHTGLTAAAQSDTQRALGAVQLHMLAQHTAVASMAGLITPGRHENGHQLPSLASVESLDSLAVLPLHNPYEQSVSNAGLDAEMFMGEF